MLKKRKPKVPKEHLHIPKAPVEKGVKATLLWLLSYHTKMIMFFVSLIVFIVLLFSVLSITVGVNQRGKLKIQEIKVNPIETKVNIGN